MPVGRVLLITPSARNTDQNAAPRTQKPQHLFEGRQGILQVFEHIVHDDAFKTPALKGELSFFAPVGFKSTPPAELNCERIDVHAHCARIRSKEIAYPAAHIEHPADQVTPQPRVLKVPSIQERPAAAPAKVPEIFFVSAGFPHECP